MLPSPSPETICCSPRAKTCWQARCSSWQAATSHSIETEGWWSQSVAAAGPEGDLRMVLNLEKIVPSPYFRSYWVQQNITDMKQYSAAISDLTRSGKRIPRRARPFAKGARDGRYFWRIGAGRRCRSCAPGSGASRSLRGEGKPNARGLPRASGNQDSCSAPGPCRLRKSWLRKYNSLAVRLAPARIWRLASINLP